MNDFNWLPLRLNILPLLHKQTQKIFDVFLLTRQQVLDGDILSLQTITSIRQKVEERLKAIDIFYANNCKDPRTKYMFALRTVLVQILQGCQQFDKFNTESLQDGANFQSEQKTNRFRKSPGSSPRSSKGKNSPKNNLKSQIYKPGQSSVNKRLFQMGSQKPNTNKVQTEDKSELRLSDLKKNTSNKSRTPRKNQSQYGEKAPKGSSKKVEGGQTRRMQEESTALRLIEQQKKETLQRMRQTEGVINKSMRDLSELVFTIKMTKQEYNEFMKLKRLNHHA